jgi:subtilisin family serine protease
VGANPDVRLHIVKVFGDDDLTGGACAWTYSSKLVVALDKCVAAGANVVSMSLGGPRSSLSERRAFQRANRAGVLAIAAAGNAGNTRKAYPAGYPAVLSVAAVDADELVAGFSQKNSDVELSAPGVGVLSTVPWLNERTLTAGAITWSGNAVAETPDTSAASGPLVDGGQCLATPGGGLWTGKVVLCQRGTNFFDQKVAAVQTGGGVAAVLYNNAASDATCGPLYATLLGGIPATIPAIGLSCAQGAEALTHAGAGGQVVSRLAAPASAYEAWSGTSMATPHVSAVAALIWSCHPRRTNNAIRDALTSTARDLGAPGRDNAYGFGLVQAKDALLALGSLGSCTLN